MIQVDDLSISYGDELIFEKVSFVVNPKERCSLVGRNGSGKTTLLRLLVGQETPDHGTISFSKGYRLGYLDQHIRFSRPTVLEEAALGLKEEEREENLYQAERLLGGLGFTEEDLQLSPSLFSGGYHLRLHLTKVLLSEPDCLLLDEPTNYLDILALRFLTKFLQKWKGELIVISHDREFMDSIATHTLGIHRKGVRKVQGTTVDFFNQIVMEEEVYEKTRLNVEKKREHLQSYIDRFGAKASKAAQAQSRKKMLQRIPALEELKKLYQLNFSFHARPFLGKKMVEMRKVDFFYQSESPLIQNLSLDIERGERIAIIGKNGYGKSTLLRLLAGELSPMKGEVQRSEQTANGYFGQTHIQQLDHDKTIEEEIALANPRLNFSDVRRICGQMMFSGDAAKKSIRVLSGGEKSRVLLGKILAKPCNVLLLDEPTHHLDIESVEALIDAIEDFEGACVIVTHSELILKRLELHKLVVCHLAKQEVFLGDYQDFLEKIGWEEEAPPKKSKPAPPVNKGGSQAWKQLQKEIARVEHLLLELESAQERDHQLLAKASSAGAMAEIQELAKVIHERDLEIHSLYDQFLHLSEEIKKR